MKEIQLNKGFVALVDDDMYEYLNQFTWYINSSGYAARSTRRVFGHKTIFMHRIILNTPDGMYTDHIDTNKLNNQRSNLRVCTHAQNRANQNNRSDNTSSFKGVTWKKANRQWAAQIGVNGKKFYIGLFDTPEEAAKAYDKEARKLFGEFANLNFE